MNKRITLLITILLLVMVSINCHKTSPLEPDTKATTPTTSPGGGGGGGGGGGDNNQPTPTPTPVDPNLECRGTWYSITDDVGNRTYLTNVLSNSNSIITVNMYDTNTMNRLDLKVCTLEIVSYDNTSDAFIGKCISFIMSNDTTLYGDYVSSLGSDIYRKIKWSLSGNNLTLYHSDWTNSSNAYDLTVYGETNNLVK